MNEASIEKAVMDIITEVDLQEKTDVAAKKLSGGQKRKLSVGIALIGDPKIIFLGLYTMFSALFCPTPNLWKVMQKQNDSKIKFHFLKCVFWSNKTYGLEYF